MHGANARAGGFPASLSPRNMWWQDNSLAVLMPGHPQKSFRTSNETKNGYVLGLSEYFYQLVNAVLPVVLAVYIAPRNGGGGGRSPSEQYFQ